MKRAMHDVPLALCPHLRDKIFGVQLLCVDKTKTENGFCQTPSIKRGAFVCGDQTNTSLPSRSAHPTPPTGILEILPLRCLPLPTSSTGRSLLDYLVQPSPVLVLDGRCTRIP